MNHNRIGERDAITRTKSGSLTRGVNALNAYQDDNNVVSNKSMWEHRNNDPSMVGAGLDDIQ